LKFLKLFFGKIPKPFLFFSKNKIFDSFGQTKVKVLFYFFLTKNIKNKIKKAGIGVQPQN